MIKKSSLLSLLIALAPALPGWAFDYNGDGAADIGIFRPRTGLWAIRGITRYYHGAAGDRPAPGDYDGGGTASGGIFRPPTGLWAPRGLGRYYMGRTGDEDVAGDYAGEGRSQLAVFRPRTGLWAIRGVTRFYFGAWGDIPVPADYSGDGKLDPAVYRGTTGLWAVRGRTRVYFGGAADRPVPADYAGDGTAGIAIFRPASGLWALRGRTRVYFGGTADVPVPADYAGDGTAGIAIFRSASGLWALRGRTRTYFGAGGDLPVSTRTARALPPLPAFGVEVIRRNFNGDYLSRARAAGAGLTRFGWIDWRNVQPSPGTPPSYDWSDYDGPLRTAADQGLKVMVIVAGVPSWAGERVCGPIDPESLPAFADFLYAAVRRYSGAPYNVKHWELFNEPDGTSGAYGAAINCWGLQGDLYAEMLRWAYPAIKAADPEAQVLFGSLAYDNCIDPDDPEDWKEFDCGFLNDVLDHGGGGYFDYMPFHYYHFAADKWGSIRGKTEHIRSQLSAYGLSQPIICPEVGIWGDESNYEIQARYVPVVYARGLAAGLEAIVWFPFSNTAGQGFEGGLIWTGSFVEKPAYHAYRTMADQLTGYLYSGTVSQDGIEGYSFRPAGGGRTRQVLWTDFEAGGGKKPIGIPAARLRVVDKLGGATEIVDGGPGDLYGSKPNGRVGIYVYPSPIYVEIFPYP